ncbi:MAG TPA: DUF695 domain-containing protein [Verrucomicrobiae bacterium]
MRTWVNKKIIYEGFPLFLRRPVGLEIEKIRPSFPILAVVSHKFTKRLPNGLPEANYNDSLAAMDIELVCAFDVDRMGVVTLIETFGGKRNYYFYVASDTDVPTTISNIAHRYPAEELSWSVYPDPYWNFITEYARDYFKD